MKAEFISQLERKVKNTIRKYKLVDRNDKIIVACSGGKDSTTTLYLLNEFGYDVEALIIDLLIGEWSKKNLKNIRKFCKDNKIKLHIINIREEFGWSICYIRSRIKAKTNLKNCTICGIIKRWLLNKKPREIGATKLATGHNLDDEAETILMNLFNGSPKLGRNLGPKTGTTRDKKFVPRVKPLYFCTNEEVEKYSKIMNFPVLYDPCPCSTGSFRRDVRKQLSKLENRHPKIKEDTVDSFLKFLPFLREVYSQKGELKYCKICGEPSRNKVCKTCKLIKILRE